MGIHPADSVGWRLKQCSTLPAAARRWLVSDIMFFGKPSVEPKDMSTASLKDLCLFIRDTGILNLCRIKFQGCTISLKAEVLPELKLMGPK